MGLLDTFWAPLFMFLPEFTFYIILGYDHISGVEGDDVGLGYEGTKLMFIMGMLMFLIGMLEVTLNGWTLALIAYLVV